jgi:hypothetical protein
MRTTRFGAVILSILFVLNAYMPKSAAQDDPEAQINDLLNRMEEAVVAGDAETYLSYIDLSDPVFALEHTRMTDDWELHPIERYDLMIDHLDVEDDTATADLTIMWVLAEDPSNRRAELPVHFTQNEAGEWLFAGEVWEFIETEGFIVRAAPGLEDAAQTVVELLPDAYEQATTSLEYAPTEVTEIKLYYTSEELDAMTLLSLPTISGWNEPGESLKLVASGGNLVPDRLMFVLIHEFTHKLTFDMADVSHGNMPWWTEEGIAQYVASEDLWGEGQQDAYLAQVQDWAQYGELADWSEITDFAQTPLDLWAFVYPQGYAMVRYISETYGEDARNEWLLDMAGDMTIEEATDAALGLSFDKLSLDFVDWLVETK